MLAAASGIPPTRTLLAKPVLHTLTFRGPDTDKRLHLALHPLRTGTSRTPLTLVNGTCKPVSWSLQPIGPCYVVNTCGQKHTVHDSPFHLSAISGKGFPFSVCFAQHCMERLVDHAH